MEEYIWEVVRDGEQGREVTMMAVLQPPQLQHVARSQLFGRASVQVSAFHAVIARQLSKTDGD